MRDLYERLMRAWDEYSEGLFWTRVGVSFSVRVTREIAVVAILLIVGREKDENVVDFEYSVVCMDL